MRQPSINGYYARGAEDHNGRPVYLKVDSNGEDKVFFYDGSAGHAKWCIGDVPAGGPTRHAHGTSTDGAKVPQGSDWQTYGDGEWAAEPKLSVTGRLQEPFWFFFKYGFWQYGFWFVSMVSMIFWFNRGFSSLTPWFCLP